MNKLANKDDRDSSTNKSIHSEKSENKYKNHPKKIKILVPGISQLDDEFENDEYIEISSMSRHKVKKYTYQHIIDEETND